jgi:hypothetical protein
MREFTCIIALELHTHIYEGPFLTIIKEIGRLGIVLRFGKIISRIIVFLQVFGLGDEIGWCGLWLRTMKVP